ncbi:TPA: HIT family protein [Candidatus Woesearchaeota archaeon]|nr:HIT family protein [Candidatus Woesearchaeota archaeon]
MTCEYCQLLDQKGSIIYEDAEVVVAVKDTVITAGQITVFTKEHFTILEMVPDSVIQKCCVMSNKVSIAVFEALGAQGTNIIINNGLGAGQKVPHVALEIVPRRENDGLILQWQPKQLMEDEMETAYLLLKAEGDKLVNIGKKQEKKEVVNAQEPVKGKIQDKAGKKNYLMGSLRRMP